MEYKTKISEEEIEELPNFTFDGEIIVIDHEDKVDAACYNWPPTNGYTYSD